MSIKNNMSLTGCLITMILFVALDVGCTVQDTDFAHTTQDIRGLICISEIHYAGTLKIQGSKVLFIDQDFVELKNYSDGVVDISGWVLEIRADQYAIITIPHNAVLAPGETYTIVNQNAGAFLKFNLIKKSLSLSQKGFTLTLKNGSDSMISDYVDFHNKIPAGLDLPGLKSSMIRKEDFFGAMDGSSLHSWIQYFPFDSVNVSGGFRVYCSPGSSAGPVDCIGAGL